MDCSGRAGGAGGADGQRRGREGAWSQVHASLPASHGQRKRLFPTGVWRGEGGLAPRRATGLPLSNPLIAPSPRAPSLGPGVRITRVRAPPGGALGLGSDGRSRVPPARVRGQGRVPRVPASARRRGAPADPEPRRHPAPHELLRPQPGVWRPGHLRRLPRKGPRASPDTPRQPGPACAPQRRGRPVCVAAPQAHVVQPGAAAAVGARLPPDHVPRHPPARALGCAYPAPRVQDPGERPAAAPRDRRCAPSGGAGVSSQDSQGSNLAPTDLTFSKLSLSVPGCKIGTISVPTASGFLN